MSYLLTQQARLHGPSKKAHVQFPFPWITRCLHGSVYITYSHNLVLSMSFKFFIATIKTNKQTNKQNKQTKQTKERKKEVQPHPNNHNAILYNRGTPSNKENETQKTTKKQTKNPHTHTQKNKTKKIQKNKQQQQITKRNIYS